MTHHGDLIIAHRVIFLRMRFWIFRIDPKKYNIADRLRDASLNPRTTWNIVQHRDDIHTGDTAFIWENGPQGGIRGFVRIDSEPSDIAEMESELPYYCGDTNTETWGSRRVLATIVNADIHLLPKDVKFAGLDDLSIFTGFTRATNYAVTPEQGARLLRLIEASRR